MKKIPTSGGTDGQRVELRRGGETVVVKLRFSVLITYRRSNTPAPHVWIPKTTTTMQRIFSTTPVDAYTHVQTALNRNHGETSRGGSRKKYLGAWPLIIWEATTAKQNYYRTNYINH